MTANDPDITELTIDRTPLGWEVTAECMGNYWSAPDWSGPDLHAILQRVADELTADALEPREPY